MQSFIIMLTYTSIICAVHIQVNVHMQKANAIKLKNTTSDNMYHVDTGTCNCLNFLVYHWSKLNNNLKRLYTELFLPSVFLPLLFQKNILPSLKFVPDTFTFFASRLIKWKICTFSNSSTDDEGKISKNKTGANISLCTVF